MSCLSCMILYTSTVSLSLFPPLVSSFVSKCIILSVHFFSHCPCPLFCHISLPLFCPRHSSLPVSFLSLSVLPQHTYLDRTLTCSQLRLICAYINWKYVHLPIKNTSYCSSLSLALWLTLACSHPQTHTHTHAQCSNYKNVILCMSLSALQIYIDGHILSLLECHFSPRDHANWLIIILRLTRLILISGCRLHQSPLTVYTTVSVLMEVNLLCMFVTDSHSEHAWIYKIKLNTRGS